MIKEYMLDNASEWDLIVKSFEKWDVYYLSGYVKAFELNGDGRAILLYYISKDKRTRAITVLIKRDIHEFEPLSRAVTKGELYDVSTPYGYGGWIVEGDGVEILGAEYEKWANQNHIITEFVRFHPVIKNQMNTPFETSYLGDTVYMETLSEEQIWSNISSKNKNMIRKAIKAGQKVYWGRDPRIINTFKEIYCEAMDRDNADEYYYFSDTFYFSILEDLKDSAMWFYTMKDDVVTAISVFLFGNGTMHYHLSGTRTKYRNLAPTNLLIYEAARWGCRNGYRTLHMGGGVGSAHDNLYAFKKSFHKGSDAEFHIGKKIFDNAVYNELVDFRKLDCNFDEGTTYFPQYRA